MVSPSSIERILTVYQNPTKSACQPPKSADVCTFLKDHSLRNVGRMADFGNRLLTLYKPRVFVPKLFSDSQQGAVELPFRAERVCRGWVLFYKTCWRFETQ